MILAIAKREAHGQIQDIGTWKFRNHSNMSSMVKQTCSLRWLHIVQLICFVSMILEWDQRSTIMLPIYGHTNDTRLYIIQSKIITRTVSSQVCHIINVFLFTQLKRHIKLTGGSTNC
jgi:hypothetical protein